MIRFIFTVLAMLISLLGLSQPTYIPDSVQHLRDMIQKTSNDTVILNGEYFIRLNEQITLINKSLTFISGVNQSTVYVDGTEGFLISELSDIKFNNIKFKNTRYSSHAVARLFYFNISNSLTTFENCSFDGIGSSGFGSLLDISGSSSKVIVSNSSFLNCSFQQSPSALISVSDSATLVIRRSYFSRNYAIQSTAVSLFNHSASSVIQSTFINLPFDYFAPTVLFSTDSTSKYTVNSSILYSKNADVIKTISQNSFHHSYSVIVEQNQTAYSDIYDEKSGAIIIDADSPLIDSGDPELLDPDETRSDIGAAYFDQSDLTSKISVLIYRPFFWIILIGVVLGFSSVLYRMKKPSVKTSDMIEIRFTGKFEIVINGVNKVQLFSKDQRELIAFLILESLIPNRSVSLEEVIITLWPEHEYRTNKNTRNVMINRLRDRLKSCGGFEFTSEGKKMYQLKALSPVTIDFVHDFSTAEPDKIEQELNQLFTDLSSTYFELKREKIKSRQKNSGWL